MDEARAVLERLERIDALRATRGSRLALLAEVRGLLRDGEAWLAAEPAGTEAAREALSRCQAALDGASTEAVPMGA